MKHFNLENLGDKVSDSFKRLNPQLFGTSTKETVAMPVVQRMPSEKPSAKAKTVSNFARRLDAINKTERRYYDTFLADRDGVDCTVLVQPPRLFELEGGGTYTPDFLVINAKGCVVVETKGGYRGPGFEQGLERWKRAAAQWADERLQFILATWYRKDGRWVVENWNPVRITTIKE